MVVDPASRVYIADTGNSRLTVLTGQFEVVAQLTGPHLAGRSVTGVCLGTEGDTILTVNWRTKVFYLKIVVFFKF